MKYRRRRSHRRAPRAGRRVKIRRLAGDPFQECLQRRLPGGVAALGLQPCQGNIVERGVHGAMADRMDGHDLAAATAPGAGVMPFDTPPERATAKPAETGIGYGQFDRYAAVPHKPLRNVARCPVPMQSPANRTRAKPCLGRSTMVGLSNFSLAARARLILSAIETLGGTTDPLTVAPPASTDEILAVEAQLGIKLPASLRNAFLAVSSGMDCFWQLPDNWLMPTALREIFGGSCNFALNRIVELEKIRLGWIEVVFPDPSHP